jgi:hypothetical protein
MPVLRIPADFLHEARRLFSRLRLASGAVGETGLAARSISGGAVFTVEVRCAFDGISLAMSNGQSWLETFRHATGAAVGLGRILLPWTAFADACRADPGTLLELAALSGRQTSGSLLRLRLRQGGVWRVSFHAAADGPAISAPTLPEGESLRLPARSMEALAAVASFADWQASADPWRSGVCFSPEQGGFLIAGNRRRLARIPLGLPLPSPGLALPFEQAFVLPLGALAVLLHSAFLGYDNQLTLPGSGEEPRVMFRAWDHVLVTPIRGGGRFEAELLRQATLPVAEYPWPLEALRRVQVLEWLRTLRDPRTPVSLNWRANGSISVVQGTGGGRRLRLTLPSAFRGEQPCGLPPQLVLSPRDLAAALKLGGHFTVTVASSGNLSLSCRSASGAFCQVESVARGVGEGRDPGESHAA